MEKFNIIASKEPDINKHILIFLIVVLYLLYNNIMNCINPIIIIIRPQ